MRILRGIQPVGMETLHTRGVRRQRHVGSSNTRRVRADPTNLPRDPRRLRARSPKPQSLPFDRKVRPEPGLGHQTSDLREDPRTVSAVHRLPRPRPPRDRARDPGTEPGQGERLQDPSQQQAGSEDAGRRVRSPRALGVCGLGLESRVGDASWALGGEWGRV